MATSLEFLSARLVLQDLGNQEVEYHPQIWLSCGGSGIEWDFVALAANWLYHAPRRHSTIHWKRDYFPSYQGFQNAYLMWESWSTRRDAPFLALLSLVRRFKATDPRDKVFAVLQHQIRHVRFSKEGQRFVARLPARSSHDVSQVAIRRFFLLTGAIGAGDSLGSQARLQPHHRGDISSGGVACNPWL